eukprot:6175994-Pleurochrysis_carterae.AAC.1
MRVEEVGMGRGKAKQRRGMTRYCAEERFLHALAGAEAKCGLYAARLQRTRLAWPERVSPE